MILTSYFIVRKLLTVRYYFIINYPFIINFNFDILNRSIIRFARLQIYSAVAADNSVIFAKAQVDTHKFRAFALADKTDKFLQTFHYACACC